MLRVALFVLLFGLSACSSTPSKQYIEPDSADGQACVSECSTNKTRCVAQGQDNYRRCREELSWRERQFQHCRQSGGRFCVKPQPCPPPQRDHCQNFYEGCFRGCGGIIHTEEDDN